MQIKTEDIRLGDTLKVWWKPGVDTITALRPYVGPLFPSGAQSATFVRAQTGMTLVGGEMNEVVTRGQQ